jgi:hypothetical protein
MVKRTSQMVGYIKNLSSSCYAVLSTLRKLKNLTPLNVRKQLVESLVTWRKRDYNDVVCYPLPQYLQRKLQQIQNAAVSFVLNKYASESDVLHELKWLPIKERTEHHLLRLVHKSQWDPSFPDYLRVEGRVINRQLRSNQSTNLVISLETGTFQDCSSKLFKSVTRNN